MSTHVLEFQSFFSFLHHFVLVKLDTSSIRFKRNECMNMGWDRIKAELNLC